MNEKVYYNENNKFAAQWLRNLIDKGLISSGDVDERSIVDVSGDDLKGYGWAHFFAGIGCWDLALRLADCAPPILSRENYLDRKLPMPTVLYQREKTGAQRRAPSMA